MEQIQEFVIEKNHYKPVARWDGELQSHISVHLHPINGGEIIRLYGKPLRRFLYFIGMTKREFAKSMHSTYMHTSRSGHQYPRKEFIGLTKAQHDLNTKYPKATVRKFKLLKQGGSIHRITTDKFISVPHEFIQSVIERRLDAEQIKYDKETTFGESSVSYRFTDAVSNGIQSGISYVNANTGDKALKFYGGAVNLVCSNGMMSGKATSSIRLVHMHDLKMLERLVEDRVSEQLANLEILPQQFLKLKEYQISKAEAQVLVYGLPMRKYLQDAIWDRLFTKSKLTDNGRMDWDGTMWGIYMAATYIASHAASIQRSTNRVAAVDVEMVEKLSTVETYHAVWDKREKLMEQDKARQAKKVEVLGK